MSSRRLEFCTLCIITETYRPEGKMRGPLRVCRSLDVERGGGTQWICIERASRLAIFFQLIFNGFIGFLIAFTVVIL